MGETIIKVMFLKKQEISDQTIASYSGTLKYSAAFNGKRHIQLISKNDILNLDSFVVL